MWRTDSFKKTLYAGKDWRQEKGVTEDEMVGWHHRLNGHESIWVTLGVGDGQQGLACCSPWGHKESDMTEQLNWTEPPDSSPFPYLGPVSAYSIRISIGVAKKPAFSASIFKNFRHTSNSRNNGSQNLIHSCVFKFCLHTIRKSHISLSQNSLVSPRHKR